MWRLVCIEGWCCIEGEDPVDGWRDVLYKRRRHPTWGGGRGMRGVLLLDTCT